MSWPWDNIGSPSIMGIDLNPLDSPIFKSTMPMFEASMTVGSWLVAPTIGARFSDYFSDFNKEQGIQSPTAWLGIQGVDMDIAHSNTMSDVIWPTAKLVGAALTVIYTQGWAAAIIPAGDIVGTQMGIDQSESDYGKYASYIGALIGAGYSLYSGGSTPTTKDKPPTTSPPQGSGRGADYEASQRTLTERLKAGGLSLKETATLVTGALAAASQYKPKPTTPPKTTTPPASAAGQNIPASQPADYGKYALIAGALFVAFKMR